LAPRSNPEPGPENGAGASHGSGGGSRADKPAGLRRRAEEAEHALAGAQRNLVSAEVRLASSQARLAQEGGFRSDEMLQLVLDTVPQCVFWKDLNSVFVGCNLPFARDAGFDDPCQVIGLTDLDMPWKQAADLYRADDREVMQTGIPRIDYEEPHPRTDGGDGWSRTSKLPLRSADGQVIGMLCIYQDVTEHKQAEEALRESEQFLESIVENIPHMIFVKDAGDLRFVRFNRAGELMTGKSRHEMLGKNDYDISPKEEADFFTLTDRGVLASGEVLDIPEESHTVGALRHRVIHTKKIPLFDETGRPSYLLGISEDITDRREADLALRQSEERYRHITETVTDYVFNVIVANGRAESTTHGPGCVAVTGYSPEEISSDPNLWLGMVVPDDREIVLDQSRMALAGEPVGAVEHRILRKDGALRWVRNAIVPRLDTSGALTGYDGLIQDITERRALQEQLLQAQKMEGIGRLAGGVAHDFNNLLTAILGYVEVARLDLPDDLAADHVLRSDLDEIAAAGDRAANLTRQLLAFASKQIVATVRLDLSAVVKDLLKMLSPLLGEDIVVETFLEPQIGTIEADPGQIQQLLVNLAVNARDAMPEGGRLIIETACEDVSEAFAAANPGARSGPHIRLSVTDAGSGMTDEVRAHLFEPFFTTKERGKGTGLGLATCHGIVRQMRGHIRVFSEPGVGTTFRIFLPQVEGSAAALSPATPSSPTPTGTETVLVVEDETVVRRLAVLGLRAQGYTVVEAADGVEALEVAARIAPNVDLVVSDVIMPGMSGPELLKRLAVVAPGAKRLLVSGHAEEAVLPAGLIDVGAAFLPKPFTPERLARKVREVLDAPQG
jgi:two-component system, cell cycle sensor histidine kinase and response regulator CckA